MTWWDLLKLPAVAVLALLGQRAWHAWKTRVEHKEQIASRAPAFELVHDDGMTHYLSNIGDLDASGVTLHGLTDTQSNLSRHVPDGIELRAGETHRLLIGSTWSTGKPGQLWISCDQLDDLVPVYPYV